MRIVEAIRTLFDFSKYALEEKPKKPKADLKSHTWHGISFQVRYLYPGDPISYKGRYNLIMCPLCYQKYGDHFWTNHHSKYLHLECPMCTQWFVKAQGLSLHLSRSDCGELVGLKYS